MGYIYLINELGTNNYKIGVTKATSIEQRKLKLQTGNSKELFICRYFETEHPYRLEKMLHTHYFSKRGIGEWFELTDEDALIFVTLCDKLNKTVLYLKENNPFF